MVPSPSPDPAPTDVGHEAAADAATRRQAAYAARRRAWAEAVGRPYEADPRPPPGEVDAAADE